jgi:transcriptional regulator with XRE-family HTH domain
MFRRRLREEMKTRGMSGSALAKRTAGKVGQRSVARILLEDNDPQQQVPSLDKVNALADALGVAPWYLMVDPDECEQHVIKAPKVPAQKVYNLPAPAYPPVFATTAAATKKHVKRRNK